MNRTKSVVYIAMFAAMIAVGAWITIPSVPVPFTMQTFFCILAGGLLGAKRGALSCLIYIAIGLAGIPVFTKGGGFQYVFQPTFGYLLGLVPAAFLSGYFLKKLNICKFYWMYLLFTLCAVLILAIGFAYYALITGLAGEALRAAFVSMFVLFLPAELVKAAASTFLYQSLKKYFA